MCSPVLQVVEWEQELTEPMLFILAAIAEVSLVCFTLNDTCMWPH